METTYLESISHLIEISHEIITVLTSYVNCTRAKRKFSKLYVPTSGLLKQGLQEENIQRYIELRLINLLLCWISRLLRASFPKEVFSIMGREAGIHRPGKSHGCSSVCRGKYTKHSLQVPD